jgi:hypothetical protein
MSNQRALLLMALSFVVAGLVQPHVPDAARPLNASGVVHALVLSVLLFLWCKADAAKRKVTPPFAALLLVPFVAPIGIPYYFFRTMPRRAAVVATLTAFLFLVGCSALSYAAFYVSATLFT